MPEIRPISVVACLDAAAGLMQAHQMETEPGMSSDGPHPLSHVYAALEQAGSVVAFGAFDGDELVGYSVAIIGPHLHYGYLYAHHDALYVRPGCPQGNGRPAADAGYRSRIKGARGQMRHMACQT